MTKELTRSYKDFIESKIRDFIESGFEPKELNSKLFKWQDQVLRIALRKGRFALFLDCGLGKTFMQLEWAYRVSQHTSGKVIVFCPLAVVEQTKREAELFGIDLTDIEIINYDKIHSIDASQYSGVVLDESSILKGDGKTSRLLTDMFSKYKYKLCCTATPSPNDHMELGRHSEFLGAMSHQEMLAMYFVHDSSETQKWRLRKYAVDDFWKYVCKWSLSLDDPKRIDSSQDGYDLPEIEFIEHLITVENNSGELFANANVSATDLHRDLRQTIDKRIAKTVEIVDLVDGSCLVWTLGNKEAELINKTIQGSVNVQGKDKPEVKASMLNKFSNDEIPVLITKTQIASYGMNWQNCSNMVFMSYDFKFEQFYQAVRRCYRFGQKNKVTVHLLVPESQMNVRQSIINKQNQHKEMIQQMSKYSSQADYTVLNNYEADVKKEEVKTDDYWLMNGDCVDKIDLIPDNAADLIIFSPPFADLYVYSDSPNDMGNVSNYEQFKEHFSYLIPKLRRVLKEGRVCAVHCMDLPTLKSKDGYIGLKRFSSMIADMFEEDGWFLHSEFTIWKDPLLAAVRTKTIGLAHKQVLKDTSISRCGIPDKVLCFKTKDQNPVPITKTGFKGYTPMHDHDVFPRSVETFNESWGYKPESKYSKEEQYSHHVWQRYASPIWMDIRVTDVLQYSKARDNNDEKHICPLQLPVIERLIHLYSNEGETILSPFGGIGSEGYQSVKMDRKSISIELKPSYFNVNVKNHKSATSKKLQTQLF